MYFKKKVRISNAKFDLNKMLDNAYLKGIPLLVIGNKIDVKDHMTESEIIESILTRTFFGLYTRK